MNQMPVLFVGHGSPMIGVEENSFTQSLNRLGGQLPRPQAIALVSAHWVTPGTRVSTQASPQQIYDFGGFPQKLYEVKYPAPGAPEEAKVLVGELGFSPDESWGLDHGAWTVLKHLYPKADIPTFQISLDLNQKLSGHFELGQKLGILRKRGVLLIGSGNLTHNLRDLDFNEDAEPFDWAVDFDAKAKRALDARDFDAFIHPQDTWGEKAFRRAHPTAEHYLPLLYVLGASQNGDALSYPYEGIQNGSLSMRAVLFQ
ncbi:MAG TPA: 4,5-DOPA dioxygenase extradiol [bacterium]|nr:4,5-DOPA dioxygenase extradiol [bacterium]